MFLQYITQMPLRRKLAPKRRLIRRKTMMKRRAIIPRSPRQPVQYFKRSQYYSGVYANSTTADTFYSIPFSLNALPNYTEFTALYDQYRINGVKVTIIPRGNSAEIGASATTGQAVGVFSVIDYDDGSLLTSIQQACQYPNMKMTRSNQMHMRYLKPRCELAGTITSTPTTGAIMATRGWIDADAAGVPHYGLKLIFQQSPNTVQQFDLKLDYYLAFKSVR